MKGKLIFLLLIVLNFSLNSQEIYDNFYKFKVELYNIRLTCICGLSAMSG